jgi:hypothetical protein
MDSPSLDRSQGQSRWSISRMKARKKQTTVSASLSRWRLFTSTIRRTLLRSNQCRSGPIYRAMRWLSFGMTRYGAALFPLKPEASNASLCGAFIFPPASITRGSSAGLQVFSRQRSARVSSWSAGKTLPAAASSTIGGARGSFEDRCGPNCFVCEVYRSADSRDFAPVGSAAAALNRLRLLEGGYRRDHVRAFAQRVEVADDAIYIKGSKGTLLRRLWPQKAGNRWESAFPVLYRSGGESGRRTKFMFKV